MTREEAIKREADMDYKDLIERLNNAAGGPAGRKMCQDAAKAITDLLIRVEKAEKERDAAVKTIFQWTGCPECKYWDSENYWCEKHDREAEPSDGCSTPEWRGKKEE